MTNSMVAIVKKILSRYSQRFRPQQVDVPNGGFSGASIVRVRCPAGDFCLRGWQSGELPLQRILGLHALMRHIFERGVNQVSVPVKSEEGSTLIEARDRLWQLEPWMPGDSDFWKNPREELLRSAMRCLAAWHTAAATFKPHAEQATWFASCSDVRSPAVLERSGQINRWLQEKCSRLERKIPTAKPPEFRDIGRRLLDLFRRASPEVNYQLRAAAQVRYALQPCLRDIWHDHVLFSGDRVTGLIDASACRSENVATDLARLLGSLVADDRKAWDLSLQEYQRYRRLSPDELGLVLVLDSSGVLLSGMTWLDRLFLQGKQYTDVDHRRILDRLQRTASRLENMISTM